MFDWLDKLYCRFKNWLYGIKPYPYLEDYNQLNRELNIG